MLVVGTMLSANQRCWARREQPMTLLSGTTTVSRLYLLNIETGVHDSINRPFNNQQEAIMVAW